MPHTQKPKHLLDSGVLHIPRSFAVAYEEMIDFHGLRDQAEDTTHNNKVFGGETDELTLEYFAKRHILSAARCQCLCLDPNGDLREISQDFLVSLSYGAITLLDLPSASGAGVLCIISIIAELRRLEIAPLLPLNIRVVACDISGKALELYEENMSKLTTYWAESGISVEVVYNSWDASSISSTEEIMNVVLADTATDEYVVLFHAFSGFSKAILPGLSNSFEIILARLRHKRYSVIWIEPESSQALSLLKQIKMWILKMPWMKSNPDSPVGS